MSDSFLTPNDVPDIQHLSELLDATVHDALYSSGETPLEAVTAPLNAAPVPQTVSEVVAQVGGAIAQAIKSNSATVLGGAGVQREDITPVVIAANGAEGATKAPGKLVKFVKWLAELTLSVVILLTTIATIALVVYLLYYCYPRPYFICHSESFSSFMTEYSTELLDNFATVQKAQEDLKRPDSVLKAYANLVGDAAMFDSLAGLVLPSGGKPENIARVLRFWDSLTDTKLESNAAKTDLMMIDDEESYLNMDGEPIASKLQPLFDLRQQLGELRNKARSACERIAKAEDTSTANTFGWLAGLREDAKAEKIKEMLAANYSVAGLTGSVDGTHPPCHTLFYSNGKGCEQPLSERPDMLLYCELLRNNMLGGLRSNPGVVRFIDAYVLKDKVESQIKGGPPEPRAALIGRTIMAVYELNLALNTYFEDIRAGYETRKVGFRWNYTVLRYYFAPYVRFIFEVKIGKELWQRHSRNFMAGMNSFNNMWASIPKFLGKLPAKLSGADGFTPRVTAAQPKQQSAGVMGRLDCAREWLTWLTEDLWLEEEFLVQGPLVEHFGFLKGLLSIGQFFTSILTLAKGIVKLLTNPFAIIMMILGFILAALLMIVYVLLTALFIHVIFGFFYAVFTVTLAAVLWTVLYTLLVVPLTILFMVLWILDMCTGGLIMTLLRCESLPSGWYRYASYALGNRYTRTFLCALRCAKRYSPAYRTFLFYSTEVCERLASNEPSHCPQAVAYRAWRGEPLDEPATFQDFATSPKLALMSEDDRRTYLQSTYNRKKKHLLACDDVTKDDYRGMGKKADYRYYHIIKAACRHGAHSVQVASNPKLAQALRDACRITYCDVSSPASSNKFMCTCNTPPLNEESSEARPSLFAAAQNDVVVRSVGVFIVTLIGLAIIAYMMHAATDPESVAISNLIAKLRLNRNK